MVSWNLGENITIFGGREDDGGRWRWGQNKGLQIRLKKIFNLGVMSKFRTHCLRPQVANTVKGGVERNSEV